MLSIMLMSKFVPNFVPSWHNGYITKVIVLAIYHKQQKLSERKVSWFNRICENVEKTFMILLP